MRADISKIFDVIVCEPKPSGADALIDFMRHGIEIRKTTWQWNFSCFLVETRKT